MPDLSSSVLCFNGAAFAVYQGYGTGVIYKQGWTSVMEQRIQGCYRGIRVRTPV
jgi:hypothetical protein